MLTMSTKNQRKERCEQFALATPFKKNTKKEFLTRVLLSLRQTDPNNTQIMGLANAMHAQCEMLKVKCER